ncbi:MAG: signal peptidase I [Thermacetogeniaceae bacterium]
MFRRSLLLGWAFVLLFTAGVALLVFQVLPRLAGGFFSTYVLQPALWLFLCFVITRLPRCRALCKARLRPVLVRLALGVAFFQVYLMVIAGFFDGFGKSPNSFTPLGIAINIVYVGSGLLGMEFSRAWLLGRVLRRPATSLPAFIALIFTLISLPFGQFPGRGSTLESVARFAGSSFLPLFMENLLASFLAMWGGALPSLAYRGVLAAFSWFSPVVPDLNWAMKALAGTAVPAVGLAVIQEYCFSTAAHAAHGRAAKGGVVRWVMGSVAAVVFIWFSLGVFPVRPAVIYSGSMRPAFEVGDIVIVAKRNPKLLRVGDVISYRSKGSPVPTVHRIVAIRNESGREVFITRGDANTRDDPPVPEENVTGKVILVVPRLGWASIAVRELFT